jgi:hypothetical protein
MTDLYALCLCLSVDPCCAVLCCAVLCRAVSCCACCVVLCRAVLCCVVLEGSPYKRAQYLIAEPDHGFCDGAQHQRQDRFRASPYDSGEERGSVREEDLRFLCHVVILYMHG